ncbi:hypothetical protein TcasGA2_TC005162 [Tribolium castaneum]|uniref:Uncharacterized protein n=1 Tax=Tribolium castaneum TaxID=7070 RepID=D6X1P0_TRICA|nr:hypothetical protein TcasGA2_TC005162 [Tribolium castaneum]
MTALTALHDQTISGVIPTRYMIIALTMNGQSFAVSLRRRKLLVGMSYESIRPRNSKHVKLPNDPAIRFRSIRDTPSIFL